MSAYSDVRAKQHAANQRAKQQRLDAKAKADAKKAASDAKNAERKAKQNARRAGKTSSYGSRGGNSSSDDSPVEEEVCRNDSPSSIEEEIQPPAIKDDRPEGWHVKIGRCDEQGWFLHATLVDEGAVVRQEAFYDSLYAESPSPLRVAAEKHWVPPRLASSALRRVQREW